jgi:hypothetical protein
MVHLSNTPLRGGWGGGGPGLQGASAEAGQATRHLACTGMHTYIYILIHTITYLCHAAGRLACAGMHTLIHLYTYTLIRLYTYTLIHLYTYTLIHLYTYTLIRLYTYTP